MYRGVCDNARIRYTLHLMSKGKACGPIFVGEMDPGNVLVYATIPVFITHFLWQIHNVLGILVNILYFGAYLCLRK